MAMNNSTEGPAAAVLDGAPGARPLARVRVAPAAGFLKREPPFTAARRERLRRRLRDRLAATAAQLGLEPSRTSAPRPLPWQAGHRPRLPLPAAWGEDPNAACLTWQAAADDPPAKLAPAETPGSMSASLGVADPAARDRILETLVKRVVRRFSADEIAGTNVTRLDWMSRHRQARIRFDEIGAFVRRAGRRAPRCERWGEATLATCLHAGGELPLEITHLPAPLEEGGAPAAAGNPDPRRALLLLPSAGLSAWWSPVHSGGHRQGRVLTVSLPALIAYLLGGYEASDDH